MLLTFCWMEAETCFGRRWKDAYRLGVAPRQPERQQVGASPKVSAIGLNPDE